LAIDCHDNIAGSACFFFNKHFDWRERDACNECRLPVTETFLNINIDTFNHKPYLPSILCQIWKKQNYKNNELKVKTNNFVIKP
jgi:hypothetical protein